MRNVFDKVEKFFDRIFSHLHGNVLRRKQNAVLIKIRVRRILHIPGFAGKRHRNGKLALAFSNAFDGGNATFRSNGE